MVTDAIDSIKIVPGEFFGFIWNQELLLLCVKIDPANGFTAVIIEKDTEIAFGVSMGDPFNGYSFS